MLAAAGLTVALLTAVGAIVVSAKPDVLPLGDPAPTIRALSSTTGPVDGGTQVTISGTDFATTPRVSFGGTRATVVSATERQIVVEAPPRRAGPVTVDVRTTEGRSRSSRSSTFTYVGAPTVESVSPDDGKAKGGTEVTVTGTDFTEDSSVTFGKSDAAQTTFVSPTTLKVTAPKHDYDQVHVRVTTPFGESETSDDSEYRYGTASERRLRVGSFNVRVASGYYKMRSSSLERPWKARLPVVAGQISREKIDVIGIQEASASGRYTVSGQSQYQDVVAALGGPYRLTNSQRYCSGGARCANGGSSSDRIIYNSDRLKLLTQGARKLDGRGARNGSARHVVWATFQDRRTDQKFFFANTHLEPGKKESLRRGQAQIVAGEIAAQNTDDLPVILVGDLAASKFSANSAHSVLTGAGFVDPLVNSRGYRSASALPGKLVNTRYRSLNNFESAPRTNGGYAIGSYLDYILLRGGDFKPTEWETVLDLGANGRFTSPIPSDHNLVKLTLTIP